ncbi:MAG TPA: DUF4129 domain-containing protein [Caulobacteraceae bacterium]|nr:DUF4129 domain-containing protein [Caulobacteraceae bacterium]
MAAQPGLFAGGTPSAGALRAAHARLLQDRSLQFDFTAPPPPKPPPNLGWLKPLIQFLAGVVHLLGYVFWGFVALAVVALVIFIAMEIARTRWPSLRRRRAPPRLAPVDWRPDAAAARALLEDADRLAAEGRYAEAARILLHRSIDDIEGRRPRLVQPAYTAREIARLDDLPSAARSTFAFIAEVVERSLFGGREVDAAGFAECRQAYEQFAFPGAWA